jgi:hypothetical protein
MIETRGRTGRKVEAGEKAPSEKESAKSRREERMRQPPSWSAAINRAGISALVLLALMMLVFGRDAKTAFGLATVALVIYVPIGYLTDSFVYRRKLAKSGR